ncbi:hypothetical protein DFH09DRAFT_1311655 [Mycena vulgaris]|nr:hypothetical protein DFH09DRAFT_1311655 [Mycena vulgaris]
MSFLKKWTSSAPTVNGKRPPARSLPDGPERGLPTLPNELIPAVLSRLDSRSLYRVAQVSRRFNELSTRDWLARHGIKTSELLSGHVIVRSDLPGEAFSALRSALFLPVAQLTELTCALPSGVDSTTIYQLDALISWLSPPAVRLTITDLDFRADMIPHATTDKAIARAVARLMCTVANDSPTTVFVLKGGLFTCRPDALRRWNPVIGHYERGWTATTYARVRMHDGSHQRVPTIRSLQTVSTRYPLDATASSPFNKWKLVVIDATTLTDLQLSIKLAPHEWAAILDALALPALVCVGIWAEAISTETSTRFFNRHPKVCTLKYMSPTADALPPGCAPLRFPRLESLNTLPGYLVFILSASAPVSSCAEDDPNGSNPAQRFPHLSHIELRPRGQLLNALQLASAHAPLSALTLWSLYPVHISSKNWPILASVRLLTLNEVDVIPALAGGLPELLARAFPALTRVEVNYSWANGEISKRQKERELRAFVSEVKAANPRVHTIVFDGREQPL